MTSQDLAKILIVDDEKAARYGMRKAIQPLGTQTEEAENGEQALRFVHSFEPDVILCDINMPKVNGLQFLKKIKNLSFPPGYRPEIIVITAYGSEKIAVEAMKAGAYDYLCKPYDIDELRLIIKNALEKIRLERENIELKKQVSMISSDRIIGESEAIQNINRLIEKVASTNVTVLITGESGTGKELVAQTIHLQSPRADMPYVTMNCAAIPRDLVESELFGHEKGAFTSAISTRQGKFELAHQGTLFLDEIADMSLETQSKILRVLEEKAFTRLGGKQVIQADVRLISATNKDLKYEMEKGHFRQDLYYRLKVVELELPSLAQRQSDIPLLAYHYLEKFSQKHQKKVDTIETEAMRLLVNYDWPGNVRQLMHVIEQGVVLSEDKKITIDDLPMEMKQRVSPTKSSFRFGDHSFSELKKQVARDFEYEIIEKALIHTHGNVSRAARLLKMKRQFLQTKMKNLGIKSEQFRKK